MEKLLTKDDLLQKLRSYSYTPDDDVIRFKPEPISLDGDASLTDG